MSVSLLALAGILGILLWRARGRRPRLEALARLPVPRVLPAGLALGAALAYLVVARRLDIHILEDAVFVLGSYGLVGLWMAPAAWRRGWPVLLLMVATLPFGYHLDTFVGYPLRVWTAGSRPPRMADAAPAGGGAEAVLLLENQVAAVDLACSGVRGLWTGCLLLLAAAWLSGSGVGWRLILAGSLQSLLLVLANLLRVVILAWVGLSLGQPLVAGWLHLPLGVLGFGAAAWAGLRCLSWRHGGELDPPVSPSSQGTSALGGAMATPSGLRDPLGLAMPALLLALLLLNLGYRPRPPLAAVAQAAGIEASPPWAWPGELGASALPLKPSEAAWLASDGADAVERVRFDNGALSGSLILVRAGTWRAHHAPERCFQVYGLKQLDSRPILLDDGRLSLRRVTLGGPGGRPSHTALYWFQSAGGRVTGDYAARIWADLSPHREAWVLVSLLFDGPVAAEAPATVTLVRTLHRAVDDGWKGTSP